MRDSITTTPPLEKILYSMAYAVWQRHRAGWLNFETKWSFNQSHDMRMARDRFQLLLPLRL